MSGVCVWRWETYDADSRQRGTGELDARHVWWADDASEVAEFALAQLMVKAAPRYGRLAGWTVKVWPDDLRDRSACAHAEDWLRINNEAR